MDDAPTPSADSPKNLEDQVQAMTQQLHKLRDEQKKTRVVTSLFTVAILVIIAAFGIGLYTSVTANLAPEKLESALIDRAEVLGPQLQRKAAEAVSLALPTYQELAVVKFNEIRPVLRDKARTIVEEVPTRLEKQLGGRMEALETSIEQMVRDEVKARYGSLDEKIIEDLTLSFTEQLIIACQSSQDKVQAMMNEQLNTLENIMVKFDMPELDTMSDDELQRQLVANVALLVVHMARNPEDLPVLPQATGEIIQ